KLERRNAATGPDRPSQAPGPSEAASDLGQHDAHRHRPVAAADGGAEVAEQVPEPPGPDTSDSGLTVLQKAAGRVRESGEAVVAENPPERRLVRAMTVPDNARRVDGDAVAGRQQPV